MLIPDWVDGDEYVAADGVCVAEFEAAGALVEYAEEEGYESEEGGGAEECGQEL